MSNTEQQGVVIDKIIEVASHVISILGYTNEMLRI